MASSEPQILEGSIEDVPCQPPTAEVAAPIALPTTATTPSKESSALGLRITVDFSESNEAKNDQDSYIVNRLLADDEPEEELLTGDDGTDKNKSLVHLIDPTGVLTTDKSLSTRNIIVTRDRRYINRTSQGGFSLGIDTNSAEWKQRRVDRGSRFGTEPNDMAMSDTVAVPDYNTEDFDVSTLYETVGLVPEVLTREADNLRLDALHLRGVDDMSTEDVLQLFTAFPPLHLEWIDDMSCNVVWQDELSAARALWFLSVAEEDSEESDDIVDQEKSNAGGLSCQMDVAEPPTESSDNNNSNAHVLAGEDKIVVDQDKSTGQAIDEGQLSVSSNEEIDEEDNDTEATLKALGVGKMYADREPGETSSISDDDAFTASAKQARSEDLKIWSVARCVKELRWRSAVWKNRNNKEKKLFLRFATILDKKQPGANKYSKYYEKYGNPNYNNMPGLISSSMRRRLAGKKRTQQLEEARAALKALGGGRRDADAAMSELAAMGAGAAIEEEEESSAQNLPNDRFQSTHSSWKGKGFSGRSFGKGFSLMRSDDQSEFQRHSRGRVGSSEGRCPPPSPRGFRRPDDSDEDDSEDVDDSELSSEEDNPISELLSSVPVRGRGSTRSKLYADDESRRKNRRTSKLQSKILRRSRSRSRSPLASTWSRPSKSRNDFFDKNEARDSRHHRSMRDRLGPSVGRHSRDRRYDGNRRRHEDLRSRLG